MNIILLGLPGTGKTTICKNLQKRHNFSYVTDYEILKSFGINFNNSYEIIDKDYFYYINEYFNKYNPKNCIFDLNYCILPSKFKNFYNFSNSIIYYLGFYGIKDDDFQNLIKNKKSNFSQNEILKIAKLLLDVSQKYKSLCEQNKIEFVSIGYNREEIIKRLEDKISEKITLSK